MSILPKRILVLAPHTDDGEFGCGGSIARLIEEEHEVFYVAFSSAEKSVPPELPRDILRTEVTQATATLGIPASNLILYNYEVRNFPHVRQDILEDMVKLNHTLRPDAVFLPSTKDTHQDHRVVTEEGFRAFKRISMLGYEVPWNNLTFDTNAFVFISPQHLQTKLASLQCYISQCGRNYATEEFIRSLAITRGAQIGTRYAEVFEVIRWVFR
jgi:LmbE family N-acetylglucosaminyl deacetylase